MKRKRLTLHPESIRVLTETGAVRGGQPNESDFCATGTCQTYKEITCVSLLRSCVTHSPASNYCC